MQRRGCTAHADEKERERERRAIDAPPELDMRTAAFFPGKKKKKKRSALHPGVDRQPLYLHERIYRFVIDILDVAYYVLLFATGSYLQSYDVSPAINLNIVLDHSHVCFA